MFREIFTEAKIKESNKIVVNPSPDGRINSKEEFLELFTYAIGWFESIYDKDVAKVIKNNQKLYDKAEKEAIRFGSFGEFKMEELAFDMDTKV